MLFEIAERSGIVIEEMECDKDHIHLLVECRPQHYIPTIIKDMKGCTARFLFKEFPELKATLWGGHLWNPSYFVATISEHTEQQVKEYIKNQKKK